MKSSLEEERRALLEQIEASRAVYRRMLSGSPSAYEAGQAQHGPASARIGDGAAGSVRSGPDFPRSRTVQWVMDHPVMVAAGVAVLVWAAPRWWSRRPAAKALPARRLHKEAAREEIPLAREGTARALITAGALLLRNPATMRTLSHFAGTVWQWLKQRPGRGTSRLFSRTTP